MEDNNSVYFNPKIPNIDARYIIMIGNLGLVCISVIFFHLQRSWLQIGLTATVAVLAELLFFKFSDKYRAQSFTQRIPSALTEAAGCLALCRSRYFWIQPLLVATAIFSKYLIKKNAQSHVFNPINFAILLFICFLPTAYFEFRTDDFGYSAYPLFHVFITGVLVTYVSNVWRLTVAYLAGVLLAIPLFLYNPNDSWIHIIGPELGAVSFIFAFFMVTDPKCTPKPVNEQIIFGVLVGVLHIFLRAQEITYSRFIAIFVMTGVYYFYTEFYNRTRIVA